MRVIASESTANDNVGYPLWGAWPWRITLTIVLSFRAILFDLDGVLVDSEAVVARSWQRWAERNGLHIPDLVRRATGRRSIETIREVAPQLDADAEAKWLEGLELDDPKDLRLIPGAASLFRSIPEHHRAVVTSGGRALAEFRLVGVGLSVPRALVTADDVQRGKPAPDGYLLAAQQLGAAPGDCLVVEDAPAGIAAGCAAGATVLGVATTFPAADLQDADVVVQSLAVVSAIVVGDQVLVSISD